jgi:hypothetical protein
MGAAKRRGTFEDRKAQSVEHNATVSGIFDRFMKIGMENLDKAKTEMLKNIWRLYDDTKTQAHF